MQAIKLELLLLLIIYGTAELVHHLTPEAMHKRRLRRNRADLRRALGRRP